MSSSVAPSLSMLRSTLLFSPDFVSSLMGTFGSPLGLNQILIGSLVRTLALRIHCELAAISMTQVDDGGINCTSCTVFPTSLQPVATSSEGAGDCGLKMRSRSESLLSGVGPEQEPLAPRPMPTKKSTINATTTRISTIVDAFGALTRSQRGLNRSTSCILSVSEISNLVITQTPRLHVWPLGHSEAQAI